MNLADAFGQLDQPDVRPADQPGSRTAAQPPVGTERAERPAVLPTSRTADQPRARVERTPDQPTTRAVVLPTAHIPDQPTSRTAVQPGRREPGKRSDPSYEKVTMLLRKATHKAVKARVVSIGEGDVSDLIEQLLTAWMKGA